ncbi:MAG: T9SS type A sorting domain-containing protein [Flavobacteriales bacterium]|nr:T9SS type A sorting domain-containing protein [Flavobacteriales bacterium]MCB9197025.1 T9SS type A sorting domain-containing protein [Flavobacteriales bacterium]
MSTLQSKYVLLTLLLTVLIGITKGQVDGRYYFIQNNDVSVIENNIELTNPWTGGMNSVQVSKIDLNSDGIEDLFVFDRTGNSIITYIWDNINSKWIFSPEYARKFPKLEYWVLLRDYNCDGKKDIFSYVSGGVGVWKNVGSSGDLEFEYVSEPYVRATLLGGTQANLFVSKVDIPDINDIDGDGDLDVLTFGIIGSRLEYYVNTSQENGYGCDSLHYEIANTCWGHFLENGNNTNTCVLFDTCQANTNVANPKGSGSRHTGSTTLSLDLNNDGVKDILLGDVSFKNIIALYNDNKGVNLNTSMVSQDTTFPSTSTPVEINLFPASFYEDVDNDGVKDFIFSPNTDNATENNKSVWMYKNTGTNSLPNPVFVKQNFLQDETIDVGTNAYPVLFDYNNDGLLDLFVGNLGYYTFGSSVLYKSKIALYENKGSSISPSFELITDNFANLYNSGLGSGFFPTFGDIDNDNDIDMIIGDQNGRIHLYLNSSGNLNTMNLSIGTSPILDDNSAIIDVGYSAKPVLFDIDNDLDLDLIIGEENGVLNYYENIGTQSNYIFRLQTSNFGGINVSEWWTTIGNSVPSLFRNSNGETQLFVGASNGQIHHYNNLDGNLNGSFTEIDTNINYVSGFSNPSPTFGYLDNDTLIDMIIGNERGGLSYFKGSSDISLGNNEITNQLYETLIYPNPSSGLFYLKGKTPNKTCIYDLDGKLQYMAYNLSTLDLSHLSKGIYIIEFGYEHSSERRKIILQ